MWVSSFVLCLQGYFIQYVSMCEREAHGVQSLSSWNQIAGSKTNMLSVYFQEAPEANTYRMAFEEVLALLFTKNPQGNWGKAMLATASV